MTPRPGYDASQTFLTLVQDNPPPCTQVDNFDLFYPESEVHYESLAREAKAVCKRCPIIAECLDWALQTNDQHGVLGGTTPQERRLIQRRKAKTLAELDRRREAAA